MIKSTAKTNNPRQRRKSAGATRTRRKPIHTTNEDHISNSELSTCEGPNSYLTGCLGKAFVAVFVTASLLLLVGGLLRYYPALKLNTTKSFVKSHVDSSTLFEIQRRHDLSLEDFIDKYDGKRPVIITDQVNKWRAMNWSKAFFIKRYGKRRIFMKATQGPLKKAESLGVILEVFASHAHEGKPDMWTYMEDELFIEQNPELRKDLGETIYLKEDFFQLFPREVRPWNAMLLWGTAHSRSSLHIDPYNWTGTNAVLSGQKKWKLYPPGQDDYLYVMRNKRCNFPLDCFKYNSPIDAYDPDLKKYPLFNEARAITFVQQPGELLIIPPGWFHQAYNLKETMAVSSQVMNTQNAKTVLDEIFKVGEIDRQKMPSYFDSLSPVDQVQVVVEQIPREVLLKGKRLTEGVLKQLEF